MNKVLLTGASGFIGRHCLAQLKKSSAEIHVVSRGRNKTGEAVTWHEVNLLKDGAVRQLIAEIQPSHLLHLAWNAEPRVYWISADNFQWVRASLEMLQAFTEYGGQRVVMAGTCAEYDWRYGWCSEDVTPLKPRTVYGTCKNSLQAMLASHSHQFGLSSAWGRVFFLFGPYEHPSRLVSSTILSLLQEQPAACTAGYQVRDFMHVEDVASAFVSLLNSDIQGSVNIASGNGLAIKDVVTKIGVTLNRSDLIRLGDLPTPPMDPPLVLADTRRLDNELGWQPSMAFDQRLNSTIDWWRANIEEFS